MTKKDGGTAETIEGRCRIKRMVESKPIASKYCTAVIALAVAAQGILSAHKFMCIVFEGDESDRRAKLDEREHFGNTAASGK